MKSPKIKKLELTSFEYRIENLGVDYNGFNQVYEKGSAMTRHPVILTVHTDTGLRGEYPITYGEAKAKSDLNSISSYLIGKNPFEREKIYNDLKRGLRHTDRTAISMIDVALWDLAGKAYDAPIYQLLGGYKTRLPTYASTYHGDQNGGLDSPEAYADFAEECGELGFSAFKIHGWGDTSARREVETIHAVGQRVGHHMDLMVDPACELETWADALKVGRACDEESFFWLEDAYKDGGVSIFGHKKLRGLLTTPILQTEHVNGLEQHVDFIANGGTDFVRTGVFEDGGITGAMKVAHAAEGFGLDVEFHGGGLPHRHCIAAVRNTNYYEYGLLNPKVENTKPPIYPAEFLDELHNIGKDGHVIVPQGPGLGVEINWDFVEKNRVGSVIYD
ncbi:MAG: N-succinyl-L-Arg/Lys racemase [Candidatus Moanabacter tarae]|uniref:N-succinyl-L-Arg/Lys racemase n=1 Tax=Candidatus Moanibacter tarae TaxID=2200854 RepID=A0A2Z4AJS9_9BACT|nr:MAG: N-succinyl-L-Arg/Lys racemase [Candidatus Moanabacter tarae]|tara:strand:+ start:2482 stop:3651 length:1170 start_codon:yes stop_codon:yes gene_type:complete